MPITKVMDAFVNTDWITDTETYSICFYDSLRLLDVDSTDDDGIQALSTSTRLQFKSQTQVHTENGSLYRVILGV